MLTRLDLLHFWPATDAAVRFAGGDTVFERDSAAMARGEGLKLRSLIRMAPRFEKVQMPNGEWRSVMLLERAGANLITSPSDFSAWGNVSVTLTPGQEDPFGGNTATLMNATVAGGHRVWTVPFTTNGTKGFSIVVKRPTWLTTHTSFHFGIFDATASAWRHLVLATWGSRRPELTNASGSGERWPAIELTNGSWELRCNADGAVSANQNIFYIYPAGTSNTGNLLVARVQAEEAIAPSSLIPGPNGSSNLRALEKFYFKNAPPPQNLLLYGRLFYQSDATAGTAWRAVFGSAAYAPPYWGIRQSTGENFSLLYNNNLGTGDQTLTVTNPVDPKPGDLIEYIGVLQDDGTARIMVAINEYNTAVNGGGAGTFGALREDWGALNRFWVNGWDATEVGCSQYDGSMVVKTGNMGNNVKTASKEAVFAEIRRFYMSLSQAA